MKVEILKIAVELLIACGLIQFIMFLLLCVFGKKYSVTITSTWGKDYCYGISAWSENGAIIKALEEFRWEIEGGRISLISNIKCILLH